MKQADVFVTYCLLQCREIHRITLPRVNSSVTTTLDDERNSAFSR